MNRETALLTWLEQQLPGESIQLQPASSDASFRRYFRIQTRAGSRIVMDAPPPLEDCRPFVDVQQRLQAAGLHVPEIFAMDLEQGFMLLEDLGDENYLQCLNEQTMPRLYGDALAALRQLQLHADVGGLPEYGETRLREEMVLFRHWLLDTHLQMGEALDDASWENLNRLLLDNALEQPTCLVHRDYHSRNLMRLHPPALNPGIIDFQDAVCGPVTYDLVSLLKDCYIRWPRMQILEWVEHYRQGLAHAGFETGDRETFQRWFDLMGVQRHLKAAGIFARLLHRDGKHGYLADVPRTLGYIEELTEEYPELAGLRPLLRDMQSRLAKLPARN